MPPPPPLVAVVLIVVVAVLAVLVQRVLLISFTTEPPPPVDYGTGQMFDTIARRYDMVNRVLALGMDMKWRRRMVHAIQQGLLLKQDVATSPRILDLATGTADVAILLAQEIPEATIVGVDPSSNMLQKGQDKVLKANLESRVSLQLQDAQQLVGLDSDSFDAATMAFGIRNVPDRTPALCQIHRVLRPSSRFCILEFSEPDESFGALGAVARVFIRKVVPFVGGILSGAPREYWHLQNSIQDFPSPREFGEILTSVRCTNSNHNKEGGGGYFELEQIVQMNFGSVQLYITVVHKEKESGSEPADDERGESATATESY